MIQEIKNESFNIGIELLRIILSFLIVVYHILARNIKCYMLDFTLNFLEFYSSTFFVMSFYFSYKSLSSKNINKTKERLLRLILPYVIWPIIIFIENNIYYFKFYQHFKYSIGNLILQLVVGRKINDVFWFQFNLIFISIFIIIIVFIFPKKIYFYFLMFIAAFAIIFNFKGYNYKIFSKYNINIYHSIGRISICIVYAIIGFFLGSFNLLRILNKHELKILLFSPIFLYALKQHKQLYILFPKIQFFFHIIFIIILFIFFGSLPLKNIMNKRIIFFIKRITGHTGGI